MGSLFDDMMCEAGVDALFLARGQAATYTPAGGGSPVSLTAIMGHLETEEEIEFDGRRVKLTGRATISTDPTSDWGGVADPALNATLTADGTEFAVARIDAKSANLATLGLVLKRAVERTRRNYRS